MCELRRSRAGSSLQLKSCDKRWNGLFYMHAYTQMIYLGVYEEWVTLSVKGWETQKEGGRSMEESRMPSVKGMYWTQTRSAKWKQNKEKVEGRMTTGRKEKRVGRHNMGIQNRKKNERFIWRGNKQRNGKDICTWCFLLLKIIFVWFRKK